MATARTEHFDPLLPDGDAMLRLAERFGSYGMYHEESVEHDIGENLAQRHDALLNFVRTGGRFGRSESLRTLATRTNYFREEYAYATPLVPGIEDFLHHEGFADAARRLYDRPVIRPSIVYANLLVPGQELAVHTDVPEFRGVNRRRDPQWLLVAMHHSGLFERWRMPIATGVAWFGHPEGGAFAFYPDGPRGAPVALPVRHNTAVLLDTDSVFHGVDRVSERRTGLPELQPGMKLEFAGDGRWRVGFRGDTVASLTWDELRFSISWKAYCYADEAEERMVAEHGDDLDRATAWKILTDDLRRRGRLSDPLPGETEIALTLIDEYIQYPPPAPGADAKT